MKKLQSWAVARLIAAPMGVLAAAVVLTAAAVPEAASAQARTECRCVDRDGNAIESCSCVGAPRIQGLLSRGSFFGDMRPRIGVSVDAMQSARYDEQGVRVTDLTEDGPADEAGLLDGDIITSIDGHSVLQPLARNVEADFDLDQSIPVQRLLAITEDLQAGQEIEVEYIRDGETRSVTLAAAELAEFEPMRGFPSQAWAGELAAGLRNFTFEFDGDQAHLSDELRELQETIKDRSLNLRFNGAPFVARGFGVNRCPSSGDGNQRVLVLHSNCAAGLELIEMKPGLASYFGTEDGVLVADVDSESALGLEPGDVILKIGDRSPTTPERVREILGSYDSDEGITFRVRRKGEEINVQGRLSR